MGRHRRPRSDQQRRADRARHRDHLQQRGHQHLYWPLREPLASTEAEQANRRLAAFLGADSGAVTTATTVLRPPNTHNFKHRPPTPVTLTRLDRHQHHAAEILHGIPELPTSRDRRQTARDPGRRSGDPLLAIAPAAYVQALTGQTVGPARKISCPFHSDSTPSLHVYPEPQDGWSCYGCGRGGSIYDLAAELWGRQTTGRDFLEVRRRLTQLLLPGPQRSR